MDSNNYPMISDEHGEFLESSNLTQNQFLMWMGQQGSPETPLYNMVFTFTIDGEIDPETFRAAFQALVNRADALRTIIEVIDGVPRQRVVPRLPYKMEFIDVSATPDAEWVFRDWLEQRKVRRLDLRVCSFDSVLIKLAPEQFKWFFNQHHILNDAWSMVLIYRQMARFYQLACEQLLNEAPALNTYQAYVEYERQFRQTNSYQQAQTYWRDKLAGPVDPVDFFGRQLSGKSHRVHCVDDYLGEERTRQLNKLAQNEEVRLLNQDLTLYTVFLTILFAYLHRVSGQAKLRIGGPFHNRPSATFKETIGLFIEIGVVQVDVSLNETLASLLKKVRNEVFADLRYAQPGISSAEHNRGYNVLLNYVHATFSDFNGIPMQSEWIHSGYNDTNHVLRLQVHDFDQLDNILLKFEFNEGVFEPVQRRWVFKHFLNLLDSFLVDRNQSISQIDLLSPEERQTIQSFSQGIEVTPAHQTIVELFEAQVSHTPQAIAVVYEDQHLTYAELNRRANQLAHFLRKLGVGTETLVGVFMERSLEMVISLYGILKAGGAYVPLDPDYPEERIVFMLEDTQVLVLLTQERLLEKLSKTQNQEMICLDSEWATIGQESPVNPINDATAENLAYVIYTSGSTGRPKGVMNEHRGICNRLLWMQDAYSLTEKDRVLQKTPFSFDVSVWEFFWPLMFGARLVVAKPGGHKDSGYLIKLIFEQEITTIHFVPSMLQAFLLDENVENCQSLKRVICSGEALPYTLQERFFSRLEIELHNLYGPTEAAVDVTYWACQRESELSTVPIGRPVANTQIYLLDSQLQPLPIGEPGELHIGGVQVARGYLNRPGLTAEKFISDPFNTDPDARLYKTGDLARYLPDGNIIYLGRLDHQVKIRGNRIELGEIEAILTQYPSVRDAVVVAHEYAPGDKRLVAYITLREATPPTMNEWRHFLSQTLPNYMVPSAFVVLNEFPLTNNGKVDRKALPIPKLDRSTLDSYFVSPGNATEETLANIWATILKLEKVGIYDNFFDLGGDSIIGIQIVAKAEQAGLRFTSQQLFNSETIATLASVAEVVADTHAEQWLVTGPTVLTPIQRWLFDQKLPEPEAWNMAVLVDVPEKIQPDLLEQTLQQLLIHHDALRARFLPVDTPVGWQQTIAESAPPPAFQAVDLNGLQELEQEARIKQTIAQLEAGHNLAEGRLVGAAYFEGAAPQSNRLFITVHHLAVDGFSWNILLQDLDTVYTQLSRGEAVFLPAKTISMKSWADRLAELAHTAGLKQELAYWLSVFDGVQPDVPLDIPDGDNSEKSTEMVLVSLDAAKTQSLLKEVPTAYNTQINDILLTALSQTFSHWTGQPSLLINLEGHGREDILENSAPPARTVGWFTSMFPVKLTLPIGVHPGERLKAIKEQLRAIPHKGLGFGLLRYLCRDEEMNRPLAGTPSPQVLFNNLGQLDTALSNTTMFRLSHAPIGWHGARNPRAHSLEINTWIFGGQLQVSWKYSKSLHRLDTIQRLAAHYMTTLEALINHCLSLEAGDFTPSDFPLADLNEQKLDQLANILDALE